MSTPASRGYVVAGLLLAVGGMVFFSLQAKRARLNFLNRSLLGGE